MKKPTANPTDEDMPYMVTPEQTLRKKIGAQVALNKIFTPDKLQKCQQMIDEAHEDSLKDIQQQVAALSEELSKSAGQPQQEEAIIRKVADMSHAIKKKMETLGFAFGFEVAQLLHDYTQDITAYNKNTLLAVQKHIDVLHVVLKDGLARNGGLIGQEMLASLRKLVKKMEG